MPSKLNLVVKLQHWIDTVPGQTFLNYAYSWGASVVILGALFKLTHLPGGNVMLFLGMGTEAFVFFLQAFDRPFDKNSVGKDLPDDFETDEEIERAENLTAAQVAGGTVIVGGGAPVVGGTAVVGGAPVVVGTPVEGGEFVERTVAEGQTAAFVGGAPVVGGVTGGTVVGGAAVAGGTNAGVDSAAVAALASAAVAAAGSSASQETPAGATTESTATETPATEGETAQVDPLTAAVNSLYDSPEGEATVEQEADKLATIIRLANDELLRRAQAVLSPEMEAATQEYIEKLQTLNETLAKVDEQSARLTRDSQEMENLNRTLIGINKVYDLHFASISRQVTTIEDINNQTKQLAAKIEEVNQIYSRMMQQLTIMTNPMGAAAAATSAPAND